jgi:hypothetical protein
MGGYAKNETGLRQAILEGFAAVVIEQGEQVDRVGGVEGLRHWEEKNGEVTVTFPVTPASTRFLLATHKGRSGRFVVDAIATDGGGIPRNFIVAKGTALVRLDALSWEEYVQKTSTNPAKILGLPGKGHLGVGADADLSVLEGSSGGTFGAISGGRIIMLSGQVVGKDNTILTTPEGLEAVKGHNLKAGVVDLNSGWFYGGRPLEG